MEPAAGNGILSALRSATGDAHRQLEDTVDIARCVADVARYRRLLENFLGFYRPLEVLVFEDHPWRENGLDVAGRYKTPWLEDDLLALGVPELKIRALPDCDQLPPATTLSEAFGCLYVLEGATLGGRQIATMFHDSPVPTGARRFFNSYGADTGARWREFLAALENHATRAPEEDRAQIVHGARETFACLQGWFMRECHSHEYPG